HTFFCFIDNYFEFYSIVTLRQIPFTIIFKISSSSDNLFGCCNLKDFHIHLGSSEAVTSSWIDLGTGMNVVRRVTNLTRSREFTPPTKCELGTLLAFPLSPVEILLTSFYGHLSATLP
ncbi:hypothetical protein M0802_016566, partial [Mischocyttarus mexicanus]